MCPGFYPVTSLSPAPPVVLSGQGSPAEPWSLWGALQPPSQPAVPPLSLLLRPAMGTVSIRVIIAHVTCLSS
jgi:hypothetical protein